MTRRTQRAVTTLLASSGVLLAQLALMAGPAGARLGYGTPSTFAAPGTGNGQLSGPAGVAVDDSSGDVYVVDEGDNRVEKFDGNGVYLSQLNGSGNPAIPAGFNGPTEVAVDNSTGASKGDVYVLDTGNNAIDKFTSSGSFLFELGGFANAVLGIATDPAGHLWVEESDNNEPEAKNDVQVYDGATENHRLRTLEPEFGRSPGIAVDSEEDLYLLRGEPNAAKFNKAGEAIFEQATNCGCGTALAVDPSTNDLLFDRGSSIAEFGPSGPYEVDGSETPLETLEGVSSSGGVAVNGATHTVYVSQHEADTVVVFPFVVLPDVTTGSASETTRTTVKLEGVVNPDGDAVTVCEFEYGTTAAYGQSVPCEVSPGSGSSPVAVTAQVSGLVPATSYHYRLIARNASGLSRGADGTLTTTVAVEGVHSGQAEDVLGTSATLTGALEPNGFDTHFLFEYGPCTSVAECESAVYSASTPSTDAGSASTSVPVTAPLGGLTPHQAYHFRLNAENSFGGTLGEERVFSTPALAPQIPAAGSAAFITASAAVISGALNPENLTTRYQFEYGPCATLATCAETQSTLDQESGQFGTIPATQQLSGLQPSTTYAFRLVGDNEAEEEGQSIGGHAIGPEATFTTAPAPAPTAQTGGYSGLASTSAVISGTVQPDQAPVTYAFELGVYEGAATQFGVVSSGSAGADGTAVQESDALSGLQPGTIYAYRIAIHSGDIENAEHALPGAPMVFTTPGLPSILASPASPALLATPTLAFPPSVATGTPRTGLGRKLTRAQLLARALKACAKRPGHKRAVCRRQAEKRYGPIHRKKK